MLTSDSLIPQGPRSDYTVAQLPGMLLLEDMNGSRSLTNDMDAVLAELCEKGVLRPDMRLYYKDSEKRWTEVILHWLPNLPRIYGWRFSGLAAAVQVVRP